MTFGLDTNIVCYMLDPAFPEHMAVDRLLRSLSPESVGAINPTILHESYHTLVYAQNWNREDARKTLGSFLRHPFVEFFNQTKAISVTAMNLAGKYGLGGRDSLILANFVANRVPKVHTHDSALLKLGQIEWRGMTTRITDPIAESKYE